MSSFQRYNSLPSHQQVSLIDTANVFRAYRLFPTGPEPGAEEIASLRNPSIRIATDANTSTISVVSVNSERDSKYSQSCWSKEAVTGSSPFVSVSVEAEQKSSSTFSSTSKKTYVTANYRLPHVIFRVDARNLVPTEDFVKSVNVALSAKDRRAQQQALAKVLSYWGHVIATHIEVGCSLMTTDISTYDSQESVADAEKSIKVSLDAAVGKYTASASASSGSSTSSSEKNIHETKIGTIDRKGGDQRTGPGDIPGWMRTVSDPTNWVIINVASVIPVTDILDHETQQHIASLSPPVVYRFPWRLDCWWASDPGRVPSHVTSPIALDLTKSLTISCWIKRAGLTEPKAFISVECPGSNNSIFWLGQIDGIANRPGVSATISGSTSSPNVFVEVIAKTPLPMLQWQHVAFVMRKGEVQAGGRPLLDKFILYIDGCEDANLTLAVNLINLPKPRICIGRRSYDSTKHDSWDGQIENVTVVQGALTQAQLAFEATQNRPDDKASFQGPLF